MRKLKLKDCFLEIQQIHLFVYVLVKHLQCFSFIEILTTLESRIKEHNNYIVELYNGEVLSKNDYDNRPFSTRVILIKIDENKNGELVQKFKDYNLLRDHKLSDIQNITHTIDISSIVRKKDRRGA
ncbi:MAG: hypothetical protein V3U92_10870 [Cellulophaga sp.]